MKWEIGTDVCKTSCVKYVTSGNYHWELSSLLCDDLNGWDGVGEFQDRGAICVHTADSLCDTTETTIFTQYCKQLYSNKKLKRRRK